MEEMFITEEMLSDLGIDLEVEDTVAILAELNDTLQERVGNDIAALLGDAERDELQHLQETADDEVIDEWLERHVPNIEDIVSNHVVSLLEDLTESADSSEDTPVIQA